ncbi:MAG: DNA mismatch repair protein MutS [Armatimonadota bacterium]
MPKLTPMFRQYNSVKQQYPDVLLLFRMGDFYELFGEDAEIAAGELELTLTSREAGKGNRIPMCGVPHHAVERYLARLIRKGYRAAICDQVEDPKQAKGLVRREVTRVVTPGTVLEDSMLEHGSHNYLAALAREGGRIGIAAADVSTGDFLVTEISQAAGAAGPDGLGGVLDELHRLQPAEILLPDGLYDDEGLRPPIEQSLPARITRIETDEFPSRSPADALAEHFGVSSLRGYGCQDMPAAIAAGATVLAYLRANHLAALPHIPGIGTYSVQDFMVLDGTTRRNLELTQSLHAGSREGSLLGVLDKTLTPMGARLCKQWVLQPLLDRKAIEQRLDAVEELVNAPDLAEGVAQKLRRIRDIERLMSRTAAGTANARDLRGLHESLTHLPAVRAALEQGCVARVARQPVQPSANEDTGSKLSAPHGNEAGLLSDIHSRIDTLEDVAELIDTSLVEDPPAIITDGGMMRGGVDPALDDLRGASSSGKQWIAALEATERERTGIKSLKVGFNQVFGYYIEISKANLSLAPDDYIRKQTLTNAERFITPGLKEQEAKVLGAEEKIAELERELFIRLREQVAAHAARALQTARALGELDVLLGFARVAVENAYSKPVIGDGDEVRIDGGRHPVVELADMGRAFVPNDCLANTGADRMLIVTGPNMAGKSTYLRQVALIVLMAQIGSFVPARAAKIGIVDRIFTRVGARDDLASGQSTFMVEMTEAANILYNATQHSLVVLDEIGRGTSTFDGLAIAWAIAEYILKHIGAKTLFATHYHHLNELAEIMEGVRNYRILVKEEGDDITFLHKIAPGGTDRSYGVQVARLAGLPPEVIDRARQVLHTLEQDQVSSISPDTSRVGPPMQLQLFEAAPDPLIESLKDLDLDAMTPMEALTWLNEAKRRAEERKRGQ